MVYKTLKQHPQLPKRADNIFMCVGKDRFLELCDLFPQTKSNLIRNSLIRRKQFMKEKNCNSRKYWKTRGSVNFEDRPNKVMDDLD